MFLFLTGMMGVGKSTVGKILARKLDLSFVDLDLQIEDDTGLSIPELFSSKGELEFRKQELTSFQAVCTQNPSVVSLGGGTLCNENAWQTIPKNVTVVWLDAELDTLVERTKQAHNRPLLRENPKQVLERLSVERAPWYAKATHRVDTTRLEPIEVAKQIMGLIKGDPS